MEKQSCFAPELGRSTRVGRVLKRLMDRANLKQNELARRSGVSSATITNLIRGHTTAGKAVITSPEILNWLAVGLATHGPDEVDIEAADQAYAELMLAIGYLDPPSLRLAPIPESARRIADANPDLAITVGRRRDELTTEEYAEVERAVAAFRAEKARRRGRKIVTDAR